MPLPAPSTLRRYGLAAALVVAAVGLRLLFNPSLGDKYPFATVVLAVLVAAGYGGFGPGLFAAAVGAVLTVWLVFEPRGTFALNTSANQALVAVFLGVATGVSALGGYFRHAGTTEAVITVSAEGAEVLDAASGERQRWSVAALRTEAAQQRGWRGLLRETFQNPWHVSQALRLVGSDLDVAGGGPYTATMTATTIAVRGPEGFERIYWWPSIEQRTVMRMALRHDPEQREIA